MRWVSVCEIDLTFFHGVQSPVTNVELRWGPDWIETIKAMNCEDLNEREGIELEIGLWEREREGNLVKGRERCAHLYPYIFALGASKSKILYCYLLFVFFFLVNVLSFVSCYWWKLNACSTKIKRKMLNSSKKKIIKKYIFFTQKKQKTATRDPVRKKTTGIERKQVAIES